METSLLSDKPNPLSERVRKELLSERDGNHLQGKRACCARITVRKELLSERDGN